MNKLILITAVFAIAFSHLGHAQDSAKASSEAQLLSHYYALRDALVAGNSNRAASHAGAFIKTANSLHGSAAVKSSIDALVKDAGKISGTEDLKTQRDNFASFSTNMTTLAKAVDLGDQPVYEAYCPMKKASWLTSEKIIRNPYYGSSMLTCGEIKGTIK